MRTVQFELLRPEEIVAEKKRCPIVYFPIGPLEWHGPHLPLGTDPLNAHSTAIRVARKTGGVVLPPLFLGTDIVRPKEKLRFIGFDENIRIYGMDFPENTMPSLYAKEEVFALVVREYLAMLVKQGYKLIIIVNGHGGVSHINALKRLAEEFAYETGCRVIYTMALVDERGQNFGFGHATNVETSIMMHLFNDSVDLSTLPPKGEPLKNTRWAIVDGDTFKGMPNDDFTVRDDPRDASGELGKKLMENTVKAISEIVQKNMKELGL